MPELETIHCFEKRGLGKAPFKFVGVFEIPPASLAAANPEAYNAALRMMPRGFRCGTCNYCGMAIMTNCLVRSSDGKTFAVGSDCILKVGGAGMVKLMRRSPEFRKKAKDARERADAKVKEAWTAIVGNEADRAKLMTITVENWKKEREPWLVFAERVWPMCGKAGRKRYLKEARGLLKYLAEKENA